MSLPPNIDDIKNDAYIGISPGSPNYSIGWSYMQQNKIEEVTCWGCMEDQPNQLAHMDPGGCLYDLEWDDEKDRDIPDEKPLK